MSVVGKLLNSGLDIGGEVAENAIKKLGKETIEDVTLPKVKMARDIMANSMLQGNFWDDAFNKSARSMDSILGIYPGNKKELRSATIDFLSNPKNNVMDAKELLSQTPLLTRIYNGENHLAEQLPSGRLSSVSLASPSELRYKDLVRLYGGDKPIVTVLDPEEATKNGIWLGSGDLNTPTDFEARRSVPEHNRLMQQYLDDMGITKYDTGGFRDTAWDETDWNMRMNQGRTSSGYAEGVVPLNNQSMVMRTTRTADDEELLNDIMDEIIIRARKPGGKEWLNKIIPGLALLLGGSGAIMGNNKKEEN